MEAEDQRNEHGGFRRVLLKHMADARDCWIDWKVDFVRMEIALRVEFISPALLTDFLTMLPREDERFVKTGIVEVVEISKRFNITLIVSTEADEALYKLRAYRLIMPRDKSGRPEIELLPLAPRVSVGGHPWMQHEQHQAEFLTPWGQPTSLEKQANCAHEWQWDGQTMLAVRWTCAKCGKSELR